MPTLCRFLVSFAALACARSPFLHPSPPARPDTIAVTRQALVMHCDHSAAVRRCHCYEGKWPHRHSRQASFRKMKSTLQFVDRQPAPSLLPILRSQQQGEILALLLGDPDLEISLTEIARRTGAPHPSVHREIQRAEQAGLVTTRKIGNTRLVRANTDSPYYAGLADVLTRAFGVPAVLVDALEHIEGISAAYIYGSWAARHAGQPGKRPVGDIDLLVLGTPDRDQLYDALSSAEQQLGRPVESTVRDSTWLESGTGSFHDTVTSRPVLRLDLPSQ